jgi:hypothetical protein
MGSCRDRECVCEIQIKTSTDKKEIKDQLNMQPSLCPNNAKNEHEARITIKTYVYFQAGDA